MTDANRISRRRMLEQTAGVALAGLTVAACKPNRKSIDSESQKTSPSNAKATPDAIDEIGVGIIGCGWRSTQLVAGIGGQGKPPKEARIVAVSDVNMRRANEWAERFKCPAYQDFQELLNRQEVDVVIYATPEHWHYLPCIHAVQAGKDVYGEQPLSHTIREGRAMAEAVRKFNRVFQTGEQQRSHPATRKAAELIINGRIGRIKSIIGYKYPSPFECNFPGQPVPDGLDWDRWCGPNEVVPYNLDLYVSRVPYERTPLQPEEKNAIGPGWMSFRPYSGGELVNWGCRGLSMVQWALQTDNSGPIEIWAEPEGQKLEPLQFDKPEKRDGVEKLTGKTIIHYRFDNHVVLTLSADEERLRGGARFVGDEGEITIFRGGYECKPEGLDQDPLPPGAIRLHECDNHMENFFDCVRSREDPIMNVENGHRVATICHLGNIARRLGRHLHWDPEQEVFPSDDEANRFLETPKRKGYELPSGL